MTWRPRLLALDVDGTLVDETNEISPAVLTSVQQARDAGIHCVIATGRAVPGTVEVAQRLGIDGSLSSGLAVASNGAVVFRYDPFDVVHAITFDASEAVRRVLEAVPDALVAVEEIGVGYRTNREFPAGELGGRLTLHDVDALVAEPVTRVIIRAPDHDPAEFAEAVHTIGLTGTSYYIGYSAWVDLAPEGVSKAYGLQTVCAELGVDAADVLAVGDGNNDVEMLRWAGRGVAMGHAPDRLKEAADDVTGTVAEDGLATEIDRWL